MCPLFSPHHLTSLSHNFLRKTSKDTKQGASVLALRMSEKFEQAKGTLAIHPGQGNGGSGDEILW